MAEFQYEIKEEIGVLSESKSGWRKEVNLVSWNGAAPKTDIRDWAPDHENIESVNHRISFHIFILFEYSA